MPTVDDPQWPRASAWLAGEFPTRSSPSLAVLGVPLCRGSMTPGRTDLAPDAVRAILRRFSTYDIEHDVDLRSSRCVRGQPDVASGPWKSI